MRPKRPPILVGDYGWEEMRDLLIVQLRNCHSEEELVRIASAIAASIGTPSQIARVRKSLGIGPFKDADLRKIEGDTS